MTLSKTKKPIYLLLIKILKTARIIVVSNAVISDIVFEFLKYREDFSKIFICNEFKNNINTPAIQINDEADFANKLIEN